MEPLTYVSAADSNRNDTTAVRLEISLQATRFNKNKVSLAIATDGHPSTKSWASFMFRAGFTDGNDIPSTTREREGTSGEALLPRRVTKHSASLT